MSDLPLPTITLKFNITWVCMCGKEHALPPERFGEGEVIVRCDCGWLLELNRPDFAFSCVYVRMDNPMLHEPVPVNVPHHPRPGEVYAYGPIREAAG